MFLRTKKKNYSCQTCFPIFLLWRMENHFLKTIAKHTLKFPPYKKLN